MLGESVTDQLVKTLEQAGIRYIYGVPGDAINDLVDSIRKQESMEFIQVRHEEAGAFAASAQAKLTGELTCCVGTAGGGAIHLLNGLYDAKLDHAPVLAITGQVPRFELGSQAHQEVDSKTMFDSLAVFNEVIVSAHQLPDLAIMACRAAMIERGVAHISLPGNLASMKAEPANANFHTYVPAKLCPSDHELEGTVEAIRVAKKPVILAGVGTQGARERLLDFADHIGAPIIRSLRAKGIVGDDHPLSLGGLGLLGTRPALDAIMDCDLLIMLGTDFPYSDYLPSKATIVQVDVNPKHLGRRCPINIGLQADVGTVIEKLQLRLAKQEDRAFLKDCQKKMEGWRKQQRKMEENAEAPIKPQYLAKHIGNLADKNAIYLCDTGAVTAWCARHLSVDEHQLWTLSSNLATMAFAMSGALGAQLAYPDRQVIALIGDGGFSMLMQDFLTAVKYKLPIKVIVFNNETLNLIEMEQNTAGNVTHKTDLLNPDFAGYARLCGGEGWRVEDPNHLDDVLQSAFNSDLPCVIDVAIDRDELLMPPKIGFSEAYNFSLSKVKEIVARR